MPILSLRSSVAWSLVSLGAIVFALQPSLLSAQIEFQCVDSSSNCSALIESHGKVGKSYEFSRVWAHGSEDFGRSGVSFGSSSRGFSSDVFIKNIGSSGSARRENTGSDGGCIRLDNPIRESNTAISDSYCVSQGESENTKRQSPVLLIGNLSHLFGMNNVERKPVAFYDVGPGVSYNANLGANRLVGFNRMFGDNCSQLLFGVPCLRQVSKPDSRMTDAASTSDNKLIAHCGNLAIRVNWWSGSTGSSTVGSYDEFSVYELEDNDRAGFDLGMCQIAEQESEQQTSRPFHLVVKSGGNSLTGFDSGFVCDECLPVIVTDGGKWLAIARVQAAPPRVESTR
jgi:hypothetical protein